MCLVCSRYVKEASVAGVEPVRERAFGSELKQVQRGAQTVGSRVGHCKVGGIHSE